MKAHDIDGKLLAIGNDVEIAKAGKYLSGDEPPFGIGDRSIVNEIISDCKIAFAAKKVGINAIVEPGTYIGFEDRWIKSDLVRLIPKDKKSDSEIVFEVKEKVK